jgi:hypothetical protein
MHADGDLSAGLGVERLGLTLGRKLPMPADAGTVAIVDLSANLSIAKDSLAYAHNDPPTRANNSPRLTMTIVSAFGSGVILVTMSAFGSERWLPRIG